MRKTKIICTIGPATEKPEVLRELIQKGADVFRFNMSHSQHGWVRELVPRIRQLAADANRTVAILFDLQGPAIRTGALKKELELQRGDILELVLPGGRRSGKYSVGVNYAGLTRDISVGDTVLIDNGLMKLVVVEKKKDRVRCKVVTPGQLGSRRHINLPGVHVKLPALTKKDIVDLTVGVKLGVDFVALSFVRRKSDLDELRRFLIKKKSRGMIMAKIEEQSAVRQIDEVIAAADAVMVARGDLGVEIPMEELPIIQRRVVKRCLRLGKPVVVATQVLESMITNRIPTRAEITDAANAVFEQADAIMLSGETTIGRYPVECVKVLSRVAARIERSGGAGYAEEVLLDNERQKLVASAVVLANSLSGSKLIVFTRHGRMARYVASMRPERAPIFAFTPDEEVCRQLALCWGICPIRSQFPKDPNKTIETAEQYLRDNKLAGKGDQLVIVSDLRAGETLIDCVQFRTLK